MNAKEFDEKFSTSKSLQLFSGVGLAIFTCFMAVNWQKALSQVQTADAGQAAVSAPTPETTTTSSSVDSAESSATPIAEETPMVTEPASTSVESSPEATETATEETPMVTESAATSPESFTQTTETAAEEMPMVSESASMGADSTSEPTMVAASDITDPAMLQDLEGKVYDQIDRSWTQLPTFSNHLVYRLAVKSDGAIATYEAVNPAAKDYDNEIPLSQLTGSSSTESTDMVQESVAKFVVVFTPGGLLQVSPWVSGQS